MGYDVTFHPFKISEYKFYVEEVVENPKTYRDKIKTIHTDNEVRELLSQNIYSRISQFKNDVLNDELEYENSIGLASAAILGYLHPYWYSRGGMLSTLLDEPEFYDISENIVTIIDDKNNHIFERSINQIIGNYSSGCYIPNKNILTLKKKINKSSNKDIIEKHIGDYNLESLLNCLEYCLSNELDLLEATDICVPISGESSTYPQNLRAPHLKNIANFNNDSKKLNIEQNLNKKRKPWWKKL
jgi:uncharacterized protein (UPF0297 family)